MLLKCGPVWYPEKCGAAQWHLRMFWIYIWRKSVHIPAPLWRSLEDVLSVHQTHAYIHIPPFLYLFICFFQLKWNESCSVVSSCLPPCGLYSPWNSPDQNTVVGSLSLFQGIFPTQGSNPGLLYCRRILYQLSHKGSPWVFFVFFFSSYLFINVVI